MLVSDLDYNSTSLYHGATLTIPGAYTVIRTLDSAGLLNLFIFPYFHTSYKTHNVGTVPTFKTHNIGSVPTFKLHNIGTVPTNKMHNVLTPKFYDFL